MEIAASSDVVRRDTIVIGGSYGSLEPLQQILRALPGHLRASVLIVQHRQFGSGSVRDLLAKSCAMRIVDADDETRLDSGMVYLAPPGKHLLLSGSVLRVVHGPRENLARPSIDVLFRSVAVERGARCIGVILSGALSDGELGLDAIKRCGGYTIVQDPRHAVNAELPLAAMRITADALLPPAEIGHVLLRLLDEPAHRAQAVPRDLQIESRAALTAAAESDELGELAEHSHLTCPECDGPLWRLGALDSERYRCDSGHAFSPAALVSGQSRTLERALWVAYRTLLEHARVLAELAKRAGERSGSDYARRARELKEQASSVLTALLTLQTAGDVPA